MHLCQRWANTVSEEFPTSAVVVGGSGFIGSHLTRHLLERGCDVVSADLVPRHDDLDVKHHLWDVRGPAPKDLGKAPEVIFNLAAVHRTPGHPDREYFETNVAGALNVTKWADAIGAESICFTSSISVYGPGEDAKYETTPLAPVSSYGISKSMAEQIHQEWRRKVSTRRLKVIRPAVIFGSGERGNFTRLAHALEQKRFMYPGRDDTLKACCYIRDLVRALCFCAARPTQSEIFNACYPRTYTTRDVCTAFHDVAGYALPRKLPKSMLEVPLKGFARLRIPGSQQQVERISKLWTSTNVVPRSLTDAGFTWETDLRSGIEEWFEACGRRGFQ